MAAALQRDPVTMTLELHRLNGDTLIAEPGPAYRIVDSAGRTWDLWFEAGGAWSHYGATSPYGRIVRGLSGRASALSPDISLILPGKRALLVECKYSEEPDYVGRRGLTQVMAYAAEYRSALVAQVKALVVAPDGVVADMTHEDMVVGSVGLAGPAGLAEAVQHELES